MSMKIAFSGIGGVGGYYGGMLAGYYEHQEEVEVYFIARGENLEMIKRQGLQIRTAASSRTIHPVLVTNDPSQIGPVDYLFCTTKSYDLEENIHQLLPVIGLHTIIIPLLNGANITDRIRRLLPGHEIWYGCVYIGARLSQSGIITRFTERERLWFGDPKGNQSRQQELLKILTEAGIAALNPTDILYRIWRKFFLISIGATLTSYYNQSIGEVLKYHREDYFHLGKELRTVALAVGIQFPADIVEQVIADQEKMPYDSTTSMHTDFKQGKPTELESLTGYVVHLGSQCHITVPIYTRMYEKLKQQQ